MITVDRNVEPQDKPLAHEPMDPEEQDIPADFGQAEVIDLESIMARNTGDWYNLTLTRVNDSLVRLGVFRGEYHWHRHHHEDELFFVVSGRLLLDLPDGTIELGPGQAYTVPRTVLHRTRARERTVVLMVEPVTVKARGDR